MQLVAFEVDGRIIIVLLDVSLLYYMLVLLFCYLR